MCSATCREEGMLVLESVAVGLVRGEKRWIIDRTYSKWIITAAYTWTDMQVNQELHPMMEDKTRKQEAAMSCGWDQGKKSVTVWIHRGWKPSNCVG